MGLLRSCGSTNHPPFGGSFACPHRRYIYSKNYAKLNKIHIFVKFLAILAKRCRLRTAVAFSTHPLGGIFCITPYVADSALPKSPIKWEK